MKRFILSVLLVLASFSSIAQDRRTFVTLDAAKYLYSEYRGEEPFLTSFGVTVGQVKKIGWYASLSSSFNFVGIQPDAINYNSSPFSESYDEYGNYWGWMPIFTGESAVTVVSFIGGGVVHLNKVMDIRLGLGYGFRSISWKTVSGCWVRINDYSSSGLDIAAGMMFHIKHIVLSLDAVSYKPSKKDINHNWNNKNPLLQRTRYFEPRIGLGYYF